MATPVEIIDKALLDTHTNSANYDPATLGLEALNIVSDDINNQIPEQVKEDYFWDEFITDTAIGQTEYNITTGKNNWDGAGLIDVNLKKINKVFIKTASTDTYYKRVDYQNPGDLSKDLAEYAATQPTNDPFFYIQDRSTFIYPAPTELITDGVKLTAIYTPPAITYASPESWLALQADKHYIYSLGMEWQIYKSQGKTQEAQNAKRVYEQEKTKLMTYLKTRSNAPKIKTVGDLSLYS